MPDPELPLDTHAMRILDPFSRSLPESDDSASSIEGRDNADGDDDETTRVQGSDGYGPVAESDDLDDEKAVFLPDEEQGATQPAKPHRRSRQGLLLLPLGLLIIVLFSTWAASRKYQGRHTFHGKGLKAISVDHLANGTFATEGVEVAWSNLGDGRYTLRAEDGGIVLVNLIKGRSKVLVEGEKVTDRDGKKLPWRSFTVSGDQKRILFATDTRKQWRHSTMSNFYMHDLTTNKTSPLRPPLASPQTAIARFSPTNHSLAWVHANDVYVQFEIQSPEGGKEDRELRLTTDGSPTTFNGVPDWVYEEEVFSGDSALWWSPFSSHIAFLRSDEERVPEYEFPIYNESPSQPGAAPYPSSVVMRYPKPGYPNPLVSVKVFSLAAYRNILSARPDTPSSTAAREATYSLHFDKSFPDDDVIIAEVVWVSEDEVLVRTTNRASNIERITVFRIPSDAASAQITGLTVRETNLTREEGWFEAGQTIVPLNLTSHSNIPGYLRVMADGKGYNHIALFSPGNASEPVFLTEGPWEVDGLPVISYGRGNIYFRAANPSTQRHYWAVPLPILHTVGALYRGEKEQIWPITNTSEPASYSASFSHDAGFLVLRYNGPGTPRQELRRINLIGTDLMEMQASNDRLAEVEKEFLPVDRRWSTVHVDGVELNVEELRPADMDMSGRTKYPILFSVYGGPASQKVSYAHTTDLHHHLVTTYKYVVVTVDPRGTGFKGRDFKMCVRDQLGVLETSDVVATASHYASQSWADPQRIGVWGWSYGGYLTNKIVETNSSVFTLAISVAPVTSWLYYDSIYTERYMSTPSQNAAGYKHSSVHNMEGFRHVDYLLAHGTGDDNVHFLNTAALLDRLTVAHVRGYQFKLFTDSDHSMSKRGAYWELMHTLSEFLYEKWGTAGQKRQKMDTPDK